MVSRWKRIVVLTPIMLFVAACGGDDTADTTRAEPVPPAVQPGQTATVIPTRLPALGNAHYELWLVRGDTRHSLGQFNLDDAGRVVSTNPDDYVGDEPGSTPPLPALHLDEGFDSFDGWEISIEEKSANDSQDGPVVLAGDYAGPESELTFAVNLDDAAGGAVLWTPAAAELPQTAGIAFGTQEAEPTLQLPDLDDGWRWRAELVLGSDVLPMGTFTDPSAPDDSRVYSPPGIELPVPGEIFARNLPAGHASPLDLTAVEALVRVRLDPILESLERVTPAFPVVALRGAVPADARPGVAFALQPPSGSRLPSAIVQF